jgi:hypothetical protein
VYRYASLISVIVAAEAREWRGKVGASSEETKKYVDIAEALDKCSKQCERKNAIDATFGLLKNLLNGPFDDLDGDEWALNCLNGTVDLRTGTIKAHDPSDRITRCLDVAYRAPAQALRFKQFLSEIAWTMLRCKLSCGVGTDMGRRDRYANRSFSRWWGLGRMAKGADSGHRCHTWRVCGSGSPECTHLGECQ